MASRTSWRTLGERRSGLGLALGALAFVAAFSPSLLPRTWPQQAVVAALSGLSAYAVGVFVGYLLRPLVDWFGLRITVEESRRPLLRLLVLAAGFGAVVWTTLAFHDGRVLTARLVQAEPPTWTDDALAVAAGLALVVIVLALVGLLRLVTRAPAALMRLALPGWAARLLSVTLVLLVVAWAGNAYLVQRTMTAVSSAARALDQTPPGLAPPTSPLRSGGPGAAQSWEELGRQGQGFTAGGPDAARIEEVTGRAALEPIRVYASLAAGETPEEIAATLVAELERTGAFEREVLTVVNTTGRGWVDEFNVSAIEYLAAGDTATAAMQYSYLPSPVALVSDRRTPREAGAAVFRAVHEAWASRPAEERPRLYVAGESLGAFGGTAAFTDVDDLLAETDGAVWIGTPSFTPMLRSLTAARDRGSPEVAPVYDDARHVRFVTRPADLRRDLYGRRLGPWKHPRVVFLQYASDPIVWWSPDLVHKEPDWIGEDAGTDVNPGLRWWPLVTFWQTTIDMAVSADTPPGHGHIYEDDMVPVWADVLRGVSASAEEVTAIVEAIRSDTEDAPGEGG